MLVCGRTAANLAPVTQDLGSPSYVLLLFSTCAAAAAGAALTCACTAVAFDDGEKANLQLYQERYMFLPEDDASECCLQGCC